MTTTTYYDLNIVEGTDIVNPLTVDNPNYQKIDEAMHDNAVSGVTLATELTNATIHALTRENSDCSVIRFIATSRWKAGDSVTVDGVPVLATLPSGETLPDGAYVINANVLCVLTGTNLTVYIGKSATNANEIAYNDTNVEEELNSLNNSVATANSELSKLTNNVSMLNSNVSTLNSNLSRYNPDTDSLEVYYNGNIVGSIFCGFKIPYIYHQGNECVTLTGGWSADGYTIYSDIPVNGTVQKLSDSIVLTVNDTSSRAGVIIGTNNSLDMTNYNNVTVAYVWGGSENTLTLDITDISSGYISLMIDDYVYASGHDVRFMVTRSNTKTNVHGTGKYAMQSKAYAANLLSITVKDVYFS